MALGIRPETAFNSQRWKSGTGQDPARYLIPDSNLFHARPSIQSGPNVFEFPIGVEGFRRSGQALLGRHYYIGDDDVDIQVIHLDEARIELSGTFPGKTAVENMRQLTSLLASPTSERGKILFLPGIFERIQYVNVENYDFVHDPDDRTHSVAYTITFVKTGLGRRIKDPHGSPPIPNPSVRSRNRAKKFWRRVIVRAAVRTARQVAFEAYGNSNLWTRVVELNEQTFERVAPGVPRHRLPTYRLPEGTELLV